MATFYPIYHIVTGGSKDLGAGPGQAPVEDFDLDLAPQLSRGERSVLSYMVNPANSGVTFEMFIGGTRVIGPTHLGANDSYARQEVIGENVLTDPAKLTIMVTSGAARFHDIVLLYTRAF